MSIKATSFEKFVPREAFRTTLERLLLAANRTQWPSDSEPRSETRLKCLRSSDPFPERQTKQILWQEMYEIITRGSTMGIVSLCHYILHRYFGCSLDFSAEWLGVIANSDASVPSVLEMSRRSCDDAVWRQNGRCSRSAGPATALLTCERFQIICY